MTTITEAHLDPLFRLNDLQADVISTSQQPTAESWSEYAYAVVFANQSDWTRRLMHHSPQTANFVSALKRMMAPYTGAILPYSDIVHGDFIPDNILVRNDQIVSVIDCAFAGYGTRVIDLTNLWHYAYLSDYGLGVRTRLQRRIRQLAALDVGMVCAAYRTLAMLNWAIKHDPLEVVSHYMQQSWQMLSDLQLPVGGRAG
jgi:aminoglycoside phosphotransferase (APT) family kinase protein